MIEVESLSKHYQVHARPPGLWQATRSLFVRHYDTVRAVDGVTFAIAPGERVGFLGPNGAGKTTTLKVLSGLLYPTAGSVRVAGWDPFRRAPAFLQRITLVMGQKQQLIWDLPPGESFELHRAIYDLPRAGYRRILGELTELLDLTSLLGKPTRRLSLGERMKCELALALLHQPDVLFLDEPTIGLDVSMQAAIREFIRTYNERHGATVILTSHYMDDVVALCPRVIVIDHGRLRFDGRLEDLVRSVHPDKRLTFKLLAPVAREELATLGEIVTHEAGFAAIQVPHARLQESLRQVVARLPISDLSVGDPPLEDVMRDLFARPKASPP
ncbi:MAG: ATP-binding cassette domain-containing protein [Myxococcota bacterium]